MCAEGHRKNTAINRGGIMTQPSKSQRFERIEYSRPILKREVALSSTEANRVYRRCFDVVSRNLYALDVICAELLSLEYAEKTAAILETNFLELRNELHAGIGQAQKLYDELGIKETAKFSYTKTYAAEYSTHYALQYIELIELLDALMKMIHTIRAYGGLKSTNVKNRTYERQQRLIRFSNRLRTHSQDMWSEIKRSNDRAKPGETTEQAMEAVQIIGDIIQSPALAEEESTDHTLIPFNKKFDKKTAKKVAAKVSADADPTPSPIALDADVLEEIVNVATGQPDDQ